MQIYVGRLPGFATVDDLKCFFKGFNKKADFEIHQIRCKEGEITYGLVSIESERLARKAIRRLHMKKFMDQPVAVREFSYRASFNDRRHLSWRKKMWLGQERRLVERRDPALVSRRNHKNHAA